MSTAATRAGPPRDEDLQALYNQVWAGFAEETQAEKSSTSVSPSGRQREDLEDLYSAYAEEPQIDAGRSRVPNDSPSAPGRSASAQAGMTVSRSSSATASASLPTSPRDRPLPYTPTSPNPRPYRKLPPVPGSSAASMSTAYAMPEAKPYHPAETISSTSQRLNYNGDLSPLPSPNTSPNGSSSNGVRPRPSGEHLVDRPPRSQGLPPSPRPYYNAPSQGFPHRPSSGSSSDSPVSHPSHSLSPAAVPTAYTMPVPEFPANENGTYGAPLPDRWNGNGRNGASSPPNVRPPGAQAPQIPGYVVHPASEASLPIPPPPPPPEIVAKLGGYPVSPPPPNVHRQSPPYLSPRPALQNPPPRSSSRPNFESYGHAHSKSDVAPLPPAKDPPKVQHRPSTANTASNGSALPMRTSSSVALDLSPSAVLDRSPSFGSSNTSYGVVANLDRNPSATSTASSMGGFSTELADMSSAPTSVYSADTYHPATIPDLMTESGSHTRTLSAHSANEAGPSNGRTVYSDYPRDVKSKLGLNPEDFYEEEDDDLYEYSDSESAEDRFVNFALLSHIAMRLRDKVPRGTHVKGGIPYPRAFTGKDIVSTIQSQIQRELLINHGISTNDRRIALQIARSLQSQLFFYEVEWGGRVLEDGVEDVYMFLDDQEGASEARLEREELPTGVITMLTKCYSSDCSEEQPCYAYLCPRKQRILPDEPTPEPVDVSKRKENDWEVPEEVIKTLPASEINRQTIIHKVISKEKQYVEDLDLVESLFIKPLRAAEPPVIPADRLDDFIEDVFGNVLDLRECNRRLLENLYVRQREQAPIIQRIGDVFLDAATEFRLAYPIYVGHLPLAEKRMKDETDSNVEFRMFLEHSARNPDSRRIDLKHFLNRPSEHLQKYPVLLEAIHHETAEGNPDGDFLLEAVQAIKNLQTVAQLLTFQSAMGKGPTGKFEWHNLVSEEYRTSLPKKEAKRQMIIFELIKGEMSYVKDLESFEMMYIRPLQSADPPIIPPQRLDSFIQDVFHNYRQLLFHHRKLLENLQEIQREQHPVIRSITEAILDAFLNFRDAYLEYVPNYPIAAYRIDDEMANNTSFKAFVEQCVRHPDAHKLDIKSFINRPIPRLLRYELLLKSILEETPPEHEDQEAIPQLLEVIKALGKETEPGVASAKQKVELWRYNSNLVFKPGEQVDMDLLNENRSLIHTGKLYRQPDTGLALDGWTELFVLLFDNYVVMTKTKEREGVTKYHVNRRPIPLDLLTLANFTDPPTQRGTGFIGFRGGKHPDQPGPPNLNSADSTSDARAVYPLTIHYNGRMGGLYTLYAETAQIRTEWKQKLEEAIGLRKIVQESNKVFEIDTLSTDTFLVPSMLAGPTNPSWNNDNNVTFTGKVTCSVPFTTADGRALVAIGCAEGVWIGFRHDSRSMRRVLHLKQVTQCAMLEDFGIFLVLADKSLFAYHIEALVPSSPQSVHTSQTPQKLSKNSENVHFFSVGNLNGRTLVVYMKKNRLDNVFRVLEPVVDNINERSRAPASLGSRLGFRSQRSEWFRVYRDFFLPSETFDLIFLKAKIAILCTKGFEIMDLTDFRSATVPQRDEPRMERLARRCESCKPIGMFRSNEDEFLLCYDEFGLYVNRHGDPSRGLTTIEWEGTAEKAAWHPPYVLLFDTRFIEIRHIETGRLVQIIPGNEIRCIWDGRGSSSNMNLSTPGPDGWTENGLNQEAKVHGVMNAPEPVKTGGMGPQRGSRAIAQHVFELVPTVPLYLPGSLHSPTNSAYFPATNGPVSNSPPHSPKMTAVNSRWGM